MRGQGRGGRKERKQTRKDNQARKKQMLLKNATDHSTTLFMVKSGWLPTMWSITRRPVSGLKSIQFNIYIFPATYTHME